MAKQWGSVIFFAVVIARLGRGASATECATPATTSLLSATFTYCCICVKEEGRVACVE